MQKRSYTVHHESGSKFFVETVSPGRAAERSGWHPVSIVSVTSPIKSALPFATIGASGTYRFEAEGVVLESADLAAFNAALEKFGFKGVEETVNLLSEKAGRFLIEAGTPLCCNPGSETYWSM